MKLLILAAIVCYAYGAAVPSEERCARCDFRGGIVGYLPYEDNCHQFIQCQRTNNGYIEHVMPCKGNLVWSQKDWGCRRSKDVGATCIDGPIITGDSEEEGSGEAEQSVEVEQGIEQELKGQELIEEELVESKESDEVVNVKACDLSEGPTRSQYIHAGHTMSCAPGTIFSADECVCVHGGAPVKACKWDSPLVQFDFNENFYDVGCNQAVATTIGSMAIEDGAAKFDGHSHLEINFLSNQDFHQGAAITMWFKSESDRSVQGLFSNGDCVEEASLSLNVENDKLQDQEIKKDEWYFVAMVKTSWDVKYYINGNSPIRRNNSGGIKNTKCAVKIGGSNDDTHFIGYIDDVRVYKRSIWSWEMKTIFEAGRQ